MSTNEQVYIFNQTQNPDDVHQHSGGKVSTGSDRKLTKEQEEWMYRVSMEKQEQQQAFYRGEIEED